MTRDNYKLQVFRALSPKNNCLWALSSALIIIKIKRYLTLPNMFLDSFWTKTERDRDFHYYFFDNVHYRQVNIIFEYSVHDQALNCWKSCTMLIFRSMVRPTWQKAFNLNTNLGSGFNMHYLHYKCWFLWFIAFWSLIHGIC